MRKRRKRKGLNPWDRKSANSGRELPKKIVMPHTSVDQLHHLEVVLEKHIPTFKAKKRSMIALHLSDVAGELPHFEKCYTALTQSEEISEDDLADCMEALEVSVLHMLSHMKDLKPLLGKAVNSLAE